MRLLSYLAYLIPLVALLGSPITSYAMQVKPTEEMYNMLLLGSPLEICSSMQSNRCQSTDWIKANDMRTARLFQLTDVRRKEATRSSIWPKAREEVRVELAEALEEMAEYFGRGVVPEYRFVERFRSRAYQSLLMELSEAEYQRLLDNLELRHTESLLDVAHLEQSDTFTKNMATKFVDMLKPLAQNKQPTLLLVTAAARDAYEPVQRYQDLFEQAGARVIWLPLDPAVAFAQVFEQCHELESIRRKKDGVYDRDRVTPSRHKTQTNYCKDAHAWEAMLGQSHGIYFIDGAAQRLRDAFIQEQEPTRLLRVIAGRYVQGSLVVGAEGGAVAALVAENMLSHGTSKSALVEGAHARRAPAELCDLDESCPRDLGPDSLTYEAMGGLGLYNFGILDTAVSEKGRQVRMLRLAQTTGSAFALGVDEKTALLLNTARGYFKVAGENGLFAIEGAQGNEDLLASSFHYLRSGSKGFMSKQGLTAIQFGELKSQRQESLTIRFLDDTGIYDNLGTLCSRGKTSLLHHTHELVMQTSEESKVSDVLGRCQIQQGFIGVAKGEEIQPESDTVKK